MSEPLWDAGHYRVRLSWCNYRKLRYKRRWKCMVFGCGLMLNHGIARCPRCGWWEWFSADAEREWREEHTEGEFWG